ncbi:hypothetical protein BTH42_22115 [Burkholderia sp. SRS-W-2-2016]|uniref:hypothetical protein n=1 Tax=Burkholderia sp. SRS-W-2-2016 TaxID=1926878 RepID=UPI00094AE2DA|nr:hypothetical protein [Burkholderia sp. SRS-W-2-2016]OLL29434.1 hypothetical protein BTH42_22115 [Burkholderia sp. SRS-W-2-2016]
MNTRNIQTFLMVSAAFFAISAPARSNPGSMGALSNAISRSAQVAPARAEAGRLTQGSVSRDEDGQNS